MRISLFFVCGYIITYFTQLAQTMICNQANKENIRISMKWSLFSQESLGPNSEKIEGFYKGDNFINDIALVASSFVFCDLNTYFQF